MVAASWQAASGVAADANCRGSAWEQGSKRRRLEPTAAAAADQPAATEAAALVSGCGRADAADTAAGSGQASVPGALPLPAVPPEHVFRYDPGSRECMPGDPLVPDPHERHLVCVAPSSMEGAGEGLFAALDLPAGAVCSYYAGQRLSQVRGAPTSSHFATVMPTYHHAFPGVLQPRVVARSDHHLLLFCAQRRAARRPGPATRTLLPLASSPHAGDGGQPGVGSQRQCALHS